LEPARDDIDPPAAAPAPPPRIRFGLSAKLLVLTVMFVMLAEICIYVPSIANFRLTWLTNKLGAAHTAALVSTPRPTCRNSCPGRFSTASARARSP